VACLEASVAMENGANGSGIFRTGCMQKIFLRTLNAVSHLEDHSQEVFFLVRSMRGRAMFE